MDKTSIEVTIMTKYSGCAAEKEEKKVQET